MCVWDGRAHEGAKTESPLFPSRSGNPGNRIKTASSFCVILSLFFFPTAQMRLIACKKRQRLFAATESNLQG